MSSTTADEVVTKQRKIPDEIWLEVFKLDPTRSNGYYGYLKKCCRISKHFRTLIDSPIFDKDLFRAKPASFSGEKVDSKTKIILHPVIDSINFVAADYDRVFYKFDDPDSWRGISEERVHEILDLPCLLEFATFPATREIFLQCGGRGILIAGGHGTGMFGVTVKDLIDGALEFWNIQPDPEEDETHIDQIMEHPWTVGLDVNIPQDPPFIKGVVNLCLRLDGNY